MDGKCKRPLKMCSKGTGMNQGEKARKRSLDLGGGFVNIFFSDQH